MSVDTSKEAKSAEVSNTHLTQPIASITETSSLIDKAEAVASRIEAANKKAEELVQRNEAVAARIMLSGRAEAGSIAKTPEQSSKEKVDEEIKKTLARYK